MYLITASAVFLLIGAVCCQNETKITISQGATFILRLPGTECGQYTLLNGFLRPVLVIEKNTPKLLGGYAQRSEIIITDSGFDLTIKEANLQDQGRYKVASSKPDCKDKQYYVTVKAIQQAYLEQWGSWSTCTRPCDGTETRSRTRNCSVNGGCQDMGPLEETQACNLGDNCAHWSEWSAFGECSAKCGKGFKIRSRNCLKSSSSLLSTGDCVGPSMQSHLCMTVCEIVGVWTAWTEWSGCFPECGSGRIRNRTRICNDPRETPGCPGNYTEYEDCPSSRCTNDTNNTYTNETTDDVIHETEVASGGWLSRLNLVVFLVIAGAITLIILIVIFMLIRRRLKIKRINSARLARDTNVENATIDKRLTKAGKRQSRPDGVNVYSELGSSFCYNDSEFEDSDDEEGEDNQKNDNDNGKIDGKTDDNSDGKSIEEQENKVNNVKVDENEETYKNEESKPTESKDDVTIYDNNMADTGRNQSTDSIYSEPPEEEDPADEIHNDEVFTEPPIAVPSVRQGSAGARLFKEITGLFAGPTIKKAKKPARKKQLDDMYKKVNKNRDKQTKVAINHERDVYYDPPEYEENADVESLDGVNQDTNNVYENCDVSDGRIVPVKTNKVNSERKVSSSSQHSQINDTNGTKDEKQSDGIEQEMHWKMKEALEDSERTLKSSETSETSLSDTKTDDGEHIYVNDEITKDIKNFYVSPAYEYRHKEKEKHIYDVPKSPK